MPQRLAIVASIFLYSAWQHPVLCKNAQSGEDKKIMNDLNKKLKENFRPKLMDMQAKMKRGIIA